MFLVTNCTTVTLSKVQSRNVVLLSSWGPTFNLGKLSGSTFQQLAEPRAWGQAKAKWTEVDVFIISLDIPPPTI